jgi:DNA-directed RNA polymerase specialized sigma24 family protein
VNAPTPAGEIDLVAVLRRDPVRALGLLHARHGERLARYLKRITWGLLSAEDLQDAYQDVLHAFWRRSCQPDFDPERYLGLLCVLAQRRGLDALRRRGHRACTSVEGLLPRLDADLGDSKLGLAWREKMGPAERAEFHSVLRQVVEALPPRQRLVARVFIDHYEGFGPRDTYQPLTAAVSDVTGQPETAEAIKSVWRAARAAIAAGLKRRGYEFF